MALDESIVYTEVAEIVTGCDTEAVMAEIFLEKGIIMYACGDGHHVAEVCFNLQCIDEGHFVLAMTTVLVDGFVLWDVQLTCIMTNTICHMDWAPCCVGVFLPKGNDLTSLAIFLQMPCYVCTVLMGWVTRDFSRGGLCCQRIGCCC